MWSCISWSENNGKSPSSRSKHSVTLLGGHLYLLAGRNGNIPLKDLWRYSLGDGNWEMLDPRGERPPCLQEHTAIPYKDCIYVFGGELGFSSCNEAPLWVYNATKNTWKKVRGSKGAVVPKGRRGHTATVYRSAMLIFGGYRDLKGSCNELWAFHFESESWHLLSNGKNGAPSRHKHSMVLHDDSIWIYGGMLDLQEKMEFWRFDIVCKKWYQIKCKINPGALHSHAVCKLPSSMLVFGGERDGHPNNELWKFHFGTESWDKIVIHGIQPQARSESVALKVPELLLQGNSIISKKSPILRRCRGSGSIDRQNRFRWSNNENRRPASTPSNSATTNLSILKEISKFSQMNLTKLGQSKCSYTVLSSNESISDSSGTELIRSNCSQNISIKGLVSPTSVNGGGISRSLPRDPISVPNFATITCNALTPVEVTKLVYLDDEEAPIVRSIETAQPRPKKAFPKSASVRFSNPITTPESAEETSDYASIETGMNRLSSNYSFDKKTPESGPYSFENPHYLGPDVKSLISEKNSPDSLLEDDEIEPYAQNKIEMIEMKPIPPKTLPLNTSHSFNLNNSKKLRASSASRVERDYTTFCIFIIGGKERGHVTVFRRPLSVWKLELNSSIY